MVLYLEVQRRAQEERDKVLGHDHLPQFEDKDALPCFKAVLYEALRRNPPPTWLDRPTISFAICSRVLISCAPYRLTENDVHNGYFVPAGCLGFANSW